MRRPVGLRFALPVRTTLPRPGMRRALLLTIILGAMQVRGLSLSAQVPSALPGAVPALHLRELSVHPSPRAAAPAAPAAGDLREELLAWWQARHGARLRLLDDPAAEAPALETPPAGESSVLVLEVRGAESGYLLVARLVDPQGRQRESRTRVYSLDSRALLPALGGEILGLWVRSGGYPPAELPAPRLAAFIELASLAALDGGLGPDSEPLDCAAGPRGPILLFSDRTVSLGPRFELTTDTVRDLALRATLPQELIPTHVAVDPWGEPVVYAPGAVLRYEPEAAAPERTQLPAAGSLDFAGLPGGGAAVLDPAVLRILLRRERGPAEQEIPLPSPFYTALAAGPRGSLWVYDLEERKIRILAGAGASGPDPTTAAPKRDFEEIDSIRPLVSPEALPFPQLLRIFPDDGFLLGGAGELWRFDAGGWPLWRLKDFGAGVRQSLPAFYRLAVDDERSFYLLDPLSGRVFRFVDLEDGPAAEHGGTPTPRFASPPQAADLELAGLLRRWSEAPAGASTPGPDLRELGREALLRACLERGLLLMARSLSAPESPAPGTPERPSGEEDPDRPGTAQPGRGELERIVREEQARLLDELGRRYEETLLLSGVEDAYNAALRILRALRVEDPVSPLYPARIRELEGRRNAVREILTQEPTLELLRPLLPAPPADSEDASALRLQLRDRTGRPQQDLRFQVRILGLPGSTLFAEIPRLAARGTATLTARLESAAPAVELREDLPTRVLVLVTTTAGSGERTYWLTAPLVVPAGAQPIERRGPAPER